MATLVTSRPTIELIATAPQTLWGWPAVANFAAGGLGAGLYVAAAVGARFGPSDAILVASWLGPALVLVGFLAVAGEAGRPLRGPRVLTRVRTSWMSRELWLGGLFVVLAATEPVSGSPVRRLLAALAGAGLALAQGFILGRARGVAAWHVPPMPLLFLSSALVSGAGLLVLLAVARGGVSAALLGGAAAVLPLHVVMWWAYVTWSREAAFVEAVAPLREGRGALAIVGGGYLLPSFCLALAIALPPLGSVLATVGAIAMAGGQVYAKAALIRTAGRLRPITLDALGLERRPR